MRNRQYTIRSVPERLDRELRLRAARENKSLNSVILEALQKGCGLSESPVPRTDLDDLIGTWEEDPEFDKAVKAFEKIDQELWK